MSRRLMAFGLLSAGAALCLAVSGCGNAPPRDNDRASYASPDAGVSSAVAYDVVGEISRTFRYRTPDTFLNKRKTTAAPLFRPILKSARKKISRPDLATDLPSTAADDLKITDIRSQMTVAISLEGATRSPRENIEGYAVYSDAHDSGAHIIHRVSNALDEQYFYFKKAPATPSLNFSARLDNNVSAIRLVANQIEFLDNQGAPRLRMAPPKIIDANGKSTYPTVGLAGCKYDSNPIAPWGRSLTRPGAQKCAISVDWSKSQVKYPALLDPSWQTASTLALAVSFENATAIDGKVLIAGGYDPDGSITSYSQLFDPSTGTTAATGTMNSARVYATTTYLPAQNKVLIAGGDDADGTPLTSSETYDPTTGNWTLASTSMQTSRALHQAVFLPNSGKVLVIGGATNTTTLSSCEIYDPSTNSWATTTPASMIIPRSNATASLVTGGNYVVVAGGINEDSSLTIYPTGNTAEYYDVASNTWTALPNMSQHRAGHVAAPTADGRVLVAGGDDVDDLNIYPTSNTAEVLTPGTGGSMSTATWASPVPYSSLGRTFANALLNTDGNVYIIAGVGQSGDPDYDATVSAETDIWNPTSGWSVGPSLNDARDAAAIASVVVDGQTKIYVAGGNDDDDYGTASTIESLDVPTGCPSNDSLGDASCPTGQFCNGTLCALPSPIASPGTRCSRLKSCVSGAYCIYGRCCAVDCNQPCQACSADGTSCVNSGGSASLCSPFVCDGISSSCPTTCSGDSGCASNFYCVTSTGTCTPKQSTGGSCGANNQCLNGNCNAGVCTCVAANGSCCTNSDCITPYDACEVSSGTCTNATCVYATTGCAAGQQCVSGGTCISSSTISFSVAPTSYQYRRQRSMYTNGTVNFVATLSNLTTSAATVSAYDIGNVVIESYKLNGEQIAVTDRGCDIEAAPTNDQRNAFITLAAAGAPGSSTTFPIGGLRGLVYLAGQPTLCESVPDPTTTGSVQVVFRYRYLGPSGTAGFIGTLLSNPVTFNVQ